MTRTRWLAPLLALLFPPKCPFCHRLLPDGAGPLCPRCQQSLPWTGGHDRERAVEFTAGCVSPLLYRDSVRESVHRFKFGSCPGYAALYGTLMAQAVTDRWPDTRFDAVTWVPLSRRRRRRRGYDQARLLAEAVAGQLGVPALPLLVKCRHTPAQSLQADEAGRRVNVLNAYRLLPGAQPEGRTLLLCDDVVTTGSTLSECARILRTAGAGAVHAVTLARAVRK